MNIQIIIEGQSTESPRKYLFSIKYVLEEMLENILQWNINMIEKLLKFNNQIITWRQSKATKNIFFQWNRYLMKFKRIRKLVFKVYLWIFKVPPNINAYMQ